MRECREDEAGWGENEMKGWNGIEWSIEERSIQN